MREGKREGGREGGMRQGGRDVCEKGTNSCTTSNA